MEHYVWSLPLRDFGVDKWYMYPISGIKNNEQSKVPLIEKQTLPEILELNTGMVHVYVEPKTDVKLHDFEHPENALYIFGSAHLNPMIGHKRKEDLMVTIPTKRNNGVLWADQAMVIILYDRMLKG